MATASPGDQANASAQYASICLTLNRGKAANSYGASSAMRGRTLAAPVHSRSRMPDRVHPRSRSEAEMIAAILMGDTELYGELIRPHMRSVYLTALSYTKNGADAEDIAQEAFTRAFRKLSTFRAEAKFGTWLTSILLNEARSWLRRNATVRMDSLDGPTIFPAAMLCDRGERPLQVLERKETREQLQQALGALPGKYKEVFTLRHVQNLNVRETANALGITAASVKVRLHRARIILQKQLT